MFQAEQLGALAPPEDRLAFTSPLDLSGRPYDEAAADAVLEVTGGYPFMIQFFGALLWDAIAWPGRITKAAFDQYRQTILDALDRAFFEARLARSSHAERSVLRAIAVSGESARLQEVLNRTRQPNQTAQQLIARLQNKGLIYRPERGSLALTVPLFGDYLRRESRRRSRGETATR